MKQTLAKVNNLSGKQKLAGGSAAILAMILGTMALEGGYVNDKDDPGGETNLGITKKVAVKHGYTAPMRNLPEEVAISIYYKDYIVAPGFEPLVALNAPIVEELYDTGTNMGPKFPSLWFQQVTNEVCGTKLVVDGKVGPGTRKAFADCQIKYGATKMCLTYLDKLDGKQRDRYLYLIKRNSVLKKYQRGWLNHRINNVSRDKCKVTYGTTVA